MPSIIESESLLPCSQQSVAACCPERIESSPHSLTRCFFRSVLILSFTHMSAMCDISLQGLRLKCALILYIPHLPMDATCPTHLILLELIIVI
jgi:hypothetical protein